MSFFFFFFFFFTLRLFSFPALLGAAVDDCSPARCRKGGPEIRFPFRLKTVQPQHCGYPGFDVDCNEKRDTILVLPSKVDLFVRKVNYKLQQIHLHDPDNCLSRKLPNLNISTSPFSFLDSSTYNSLSDYIIFNCSTSRGRYESEISCLGDSGNKFYAVPSDTDMDSHSFTSCTRFSLVSSVPYDIFDPKDLFLNWSEPECGSCEQVQMRSCSFNNITRDIQCVDRPRSHKGKKLKLIAAIGSFLLVITITAIVIVSILIIRKKENQKKIESFLGDYKALKPTRFCYSDIKRITNQFSEKLGEGGYGVVYKGKLTDEISIAVKVLNNSKENGEEFVNEVRTIGRIHHVNVVRLVGFCAEGFRRVLVYEFLPNDSLEKFIFQSESKRDSLGWEKLQDIALGIAKGIEYLHEGCDQQILHFDIKPHNILLDQNFTPKVCDFGLAKLCSKEQSAVTMTAARGTMGYIAPELLSRTFGKVSYKSDVYSFGMLLLEMVGGRKNVDPKMNMSRVYFPRWIYNHLNLGDDFWAEIEEGDHGNIARKVTIVGLCCINWDPMDRPSMKEVVQMLEGDGSDLTMPTNPFPDSNATNLVAGLLERHYQAELPLILEIDE